MTSNARSLAAKHPLALLILQRLGFSIVLLVAVSFLIFIGVEALPGDFATTYLGQAATPQAVANIQAELGLDKPLLSRYLHWLAGVMHGDFGMSWASRQPVESQLVGRLENSLFLAAVAAIIAVPLAILLGLVAVLMRDGWVDRLINIITLKNGRRLCTAGVLLMTGFLSEIL